MAVFPRTIGPAVATFPWIPGPLIGKGLTGIIQARTTMAAGWVWEEQYPLLSTRVASHMELITFITKAWRAAEVFDITHPTLPGSGQSPNGLGGSILVDGAAQTGNTLLVDGYPVSTADCVVAGDVFTIDNDNTVYMVMETAASNGVGEVTIVLDPPLRVSPSNDAALTLTGVTFKGMIVRRSQFEPTVPPAIYSGFNIVVSEVLS